MAKTTSKTAAPKGEATPKESTPKETKPKESKPKSESKLKSTASGAQVLEQASEEALKKLQELGIDQQLQSELEWCLGSYRFDKNPSGLYEVAGRVLAVLNAEKAKKTKGVTSKVVGDLEKALKSQES